MAKIVLHEGRITIETDGNAVSADEERMIEKAISQYMANSGHVKAELPKFPASKNGLPPREAIEQYIKNAPNYAHNIRAVSMHFFGKEFRSNSNDMAERKKFDVIWRKTRKARQNIANRENGAWKNHKEGFGAPATYWFEKRAT